MRTAIEILADLVRLKDLKGTPEYDVAERDKLWEEARKAVYSNGWLPIEQAPKDGTSILACRKPNKTKAGHNFAESIFICNYDVRNDWYDGNWLNQTKNLCEPTHYQPLPKMPEGDL
jgi:hypothetical protein